MTKSMAIIFSLVVTSRGGVEDTRLEAKDAKKSKAKAKDSLSEDRHSRGQGQGLRAQAQVLSKKKRSSQTFFRRTPKKKVFTKFFQAISIKKRFPKNFSTAPQNFNIPKNSAVRKPRTGQFSRPRTSKSVLEDSTSGDYFTQKF